MTYLEFFALLLVLTSGALALLWRGAWWLVDWRRTLRERRRRAVEREIDRTQAQLRATILQLASQLGADAHEARKALIREAYLASGRVPDERA